MSVVSETLAELDTLGATNTVEGAAALALASMLDNAQGAIGAAGTAKMLLEAMNILRARNPAVKTDLELIRERRANRAG